MVQLAMDLGFWIMWEVRDLYCTDLVPIQNCTVAIQYMLYHTEHAKQVPSGRERDSEFGKGICMKVNVSYG